MFVRYYTHVPVGIGLVQEQVGQMRTTLEDWADVAYREGEALHARVGPVGHRYAKEVALEIGPAEVRKAGVVYPVRWSAVGAETLFPKLVANLILTHLGPERTTLSLEGTYEPPLGPIGRVVDRVLLRNLAEATVKNWVDRVAEAVSTASELI